MKKHGGLSTASQIGGCNGYKIGQIGRADAHTGKSHEIDIIVKGIGPG
jgi:hypothetical protein